MKAGGAGSRQAGRQGGRRARASLSFGAPVGLCRSVLLSVLYASAAASRCPAAFFPSPFARSRYAGGLGSGGGGQPAGFAFASFSPFALRSAVRPTHLAPAPCSRGLFKQAAAAFFRPQLSPVVAVGRLSAASATVSTTGGAVAACFHRP